MKPVSRNANETVTQVGQNHDYRITVTWDPSGPTPDIFGLLTEKGSDGKVLMYDPAGEGLVYFNELQKEGVAIDIASRGKAVITVPGSWVSDRRYLRVAASIDQDEWPGKQLKDVQLFNTLLEVMDEDSVVESYFAESNAWHNKVTCGLLADLYGNRDNFGGAVRFKNVLQGWANADISKLLAEHGADVTDGAEPAPAAEAPAAVVETPKAKLSMSKDERRAVNLQKIATISDPVVQEEVRTAYLDLTKSIDNGGVREALAKVVVALDISTSTEFSGRKYYSSGDMRKVLIEALVCAMEWDPDANVDVMTFNEGARYVGPMSVDNVSGFLQRITPGGGTNYRNLFQLVDDVYFNGPDRPGFQKGEAVYVLFATDGDPSDSKRLIEEKVDELSQKRVFIKAVALGTEKFAFLDGLDERNATRRASNPNIIDNFDLAKVTNPKTVSHKEIRELMLKEFLVAEPGERKSRFGRREAPKQPWVDQAAALLAVELPAGPSHDPVAGPAPRSTGGGLYF